MNFKGIVLLISFVLLGNVAECQNMQWVKPIVGNNLEVGMYITCDSNGNIYSAGVFDQAADFDPGPGTNILSGNGQGNGYIQKLDPIGALVWAKKFGGIDNFYDIMPNAITFDPSGYIYTCGLFYDTIDFDPGPGTYNLISNPGYWSGYLVKLDLNGNLIWAQKTDNANNSGIAIDSNGDLLIVGFFGGTADLDPGPSIYNLTSAGYSDIFVLRLSANGNFIWAKRIGGIGDDFAYDIDIDLDGYIILNGTYAGFVDFDPGPASFYLPSNGGFWDMFVLSLNSLGNFTWAAGMVGTNWGSHSSISLKVDNLGNTFVTGQFDDTVDFDPSPSNTLNLIASNPSFPQCFIQKLDAAGSLVWAKQITGDFTSGGYSIDLDAQSNIYIAGSFKGTADFDLGPGNSNLTADYRDGFVAKYDSSANIQWVIPIRSIDTTYIYANAVSNDDFGNTYATGHYNGTVDFDPSPSTYILSSTGQSDAFVYKVSNLVGLDDEPNQNRILVYPNPSNGEFRFQFKNHFGNGTISIIDMLGKQIFKTEFDLSQNTEIYLNLQQFPIGIYSAEIIIGSHKYSTRLIKGK